MFGFFKKAKQNDQATAVVQEAQDQEPQDYSVSDLGRARYEVEHHQFRDFFLKNPTGFVDALMAEFGLCELHFEALKHFKVKTRYGAGPYKIATGPTDHGGYIVRGQLPKPEFLGVCYRFYLMFNSDFSQLAYYIVERTEDGARLCEMTADGGMTVLKQQADVVDWAEAEREQKAAEIDFITRLFHGLPEKSEEEAEEAEGDEPETAEDESAESAVAEDAGDAGDAEDAGDVEPEAAEDAEVVEAEIADEPAADEAESNR